MNIYQVPLIQFIIKEHELYQLAERIDWDELERDLVDYYCIDNGRPSIPIRKIVGVVLPKRMFNNYLSGTHSDAINTLLAAAGFNMMKMLRRIKAETISFYQKLLHTLEYQLNIKISNQLISFKFR